QRDHGGRLPQSSGGAEGRVRHLAGPEGAPGGERQGHRLTHPRGPGPRTLGSAWACGEHLLEPGTVACDAWCGGRRRAKAPRWPRARGKRRPAWDLAPEGGTGSSPGRWARGEQSYPQSPSKEYAQRLLLWLPTAFGCGSLLACVPAGHRAAGLCESTTAACALLSVNLWRSW